MFLKREILIDKSELNDFKKTKKDLRKLFTKKKYNFSENKGALPEKIDQDMEYFLMRNYYIVKLSDKIISGNKDVDCVKIDWAQAYSDEKEIKTELINLSVAIFILNKTMEIVKKNKDDRSAFDYEHFMTEELEKALSNDKDAKVYEKEILKAFKLQLEELYERLPNLLPEDIDFVQKSKVKSNFVKYLYLIDRNYEEDFDEYDDVQEFRYNIYYTAYICELTVLRSLFAIFDKYCSSDKFELLP